jgi:hypothetical protein
MGLRAIAVHECAEALTDTLKESLRGGIQGVYQGNGLTKLQAQLRARQDLMFLERWGSNPTVTRTVKDENGKDVQVTLDFRTYQQQFSDVLRAVAKPGTKASGSRREGKVSGRKLSETPEAFQSFIVAAMNAKLTGLSLWVWAAANVEKAVGAIKTASEVDAKDQAMGRSLAVVDAKVDQAIADAQATGPAETKTEEQAAAGPAAVVAEAEAKVAEAKAETARKKADKAKEKAAEKAAA